MPVIVYKVCPAEDWVLAVRAGHYAGSSDDLRDGFIHLSRASQLHGTLARYFSGPDGRGREGLLLISIDATRLGSALRWEPARDGSLFPHIYGGLDPGIVERAEPLFVGPDGRHLVPGDLR